jgi:hypothetical protein
MFLMAQECDQGYLPLSVIESRAFCSVPALVRLWHCLLVPILRRAAGHDGHFYGFASIYIRACEFAAYLFVQLLAWQYVLYSAACKLA